MWRQQRGIFISLCVGRTALLRSLSTKYPFVWLFMALFSNLVKGGLPLEHLLSACQIYFNSTKKGKIFVCLLAAAKAWLMGEK
jgi:hypothetical protein